jgi:hypothetical protein
LFTRSNAVGSADATQATTNPKTAPNAIPCFVFILCNHQRAFFHLKLSIGFCYATGSTMIGFVSILAEVSDKEPTFTEIWFIAAFFGITSFLLCRWRRFAGVIVLPLAACWAWAMLLEIHDPYVGPAILDELGRGYVVQAYIASFLPFMLVTIGFWRRGRM